MPVEVEPADDPGTKSSGVGMGLSICWSIIDAHGGRVLADANELRGTDGTQDFRASGRHPHPDQMR